MDQLSYGWYQSRICFILVYVGISMLNEQGNSQPHSLQCQWLVAHLKHKKINDVLNLYNKYTD